MDQSCSKVLKTPFMTPSPTSTRCLWPARSRETSLSPTSGSSTGNEVDPSADRYTIANGQLTIQNPDRQVDQGEYVCQATNDVGTIRSLPANLVFACKCCPSKCTTFAPVTVAPMVNANVKHNTNINPNSNPNLIPYPTLNQKPNHYPQSNSLLSEISSQEQLSPKQMLDHRPITYGKGATW